MKTLKWHSNLVIDDVQTEAIVPLPAVVIEALEALFDMRFSEQYKAILRDHHGDSPLHSDYQIDNGNGEVRGGIGEFLSPDPYANETIYSAAASFPRGVLPFAADGGGNYLCFDNRNVLDGTEPSIVYYDHEFSSSDDLVHVCDKFSSLIDALEIPQDVIEDFREQGISIP